MAFAFSGLSANFYSFSKQLPLQTLAALNVNEMEVSNTVSVVLLFLSVPLHACKLNFFVHYCSLLTFLQIIIILTDEVAHSASKCCTPLLLPLHFVV